MSSRFPKRQRIEYGLKWEPLLLPVLSHYLKEALLKTEYRYSLLDFVGEKAWAELKVRSPTYHYSDAIIQKEGWLIPACKIKKAFQEFQTKDIYFFYLWESDNSLWVYKFNPSDFDGLKPTIPRWHLDKQPHYYLDQTKWELIDFLKIDRAHKQCLISDDD